VSLRTSRDHTNSQEGIRSDLNPQRVSYTVLRRAFAWILLTTMLASIALPLARATEAPEPGAYAGWLLDRGASEVNETLADALRSAARGGHQSLESFVREFAREVANRGGLEAASKAFQWSTVSGTITESELIDIILADLRALSPKEAAQMARLSPHEASALASSFRVGITSQRRRRQVQPVVAISGAAEDRQIALGLTTSIQALGP